IGENEVGANLDLGSLYPYGPSDVSWYNFDVDPRFGGKPGGGHNAIYAAHVDYAYAVHYANADYSGPGVFRDIGMLKPGDAIEVDQGGDRFCYSVVWTRVVSDANGNWGELFSANVPEGDAITLVSCTGDFNPTTRDYDSRTIVRAARS